jgi:hypothetical protein
MKMNTAAINPTINPLKIDVSKSLIAIANALKNQSKTGTKSAFARSTTFFLLAGVSLMSML